MSPSMKFGLLALVGAAAAVPHYGGHSKFHHKPSDAGSGYAGPTGGWGKNTTVAAAPTGTGYAPAPGPGGDDSTTDTTTTSTIKSTITQTMYVTPVPVGSEAPTSVGAVDVSTGAGACGPATITVTATNKVTVTVPAGGAAPSSSGGAPAPYVPEVPKESSATSVVEAGHGRPTHGGKPPAYPTGPKPTTDTPAPPKESSAYVAPAPSSSKESPAPVKPTSEAPAPMPTSDAPSATEPAKSSGYASAAPSSKPSNTPSVPASGKRGLLYRYDGASVAKGFEEMSSFGYMHNWEATPRGDIGNAVFYPTLRSLDRAGEWDAALGQSNSKVVFTFNEPDIKAQADLTPGAACEAWKTHVKPLMEKHGDKNFVAPSISSSPNPNEGLDWLKQFMTQCTEAVYSTVNIHWYGTPADGIDAFIKHVEAVSSASNKPFYVSEFAMNQCTGEQGAAFLKDAMKYLDGNSNCVGYSPFAAGAFDPGYGMTLDNLLGDATSLTPVGKAYMGSA
jgi:hypothetical protein